MNKMELLIIGELKTGFETIKNLSNRYVDWKISTAYNDEEAIEKFHRHNFEVVVFTDSVSSDEERKIRKIFTVQKPGIVIIKHQQGNDGLLIDEITTALDESSKAKAPSYTLVDDALKNAGLNIIVQ